MEDTTFETKAKDSKKIRGQGLTFRGQDLSRPETEMVEAKAKDRGHNFSKLWSVNFQQFLSAKLQNIEFRKVFGDNSKIIVF